jgi:dUTP pyrophosphatase
MSSLKVKLLSEDATAPKRMNEFDAGYDISSADDYIIYPGPHHQAVSTKIAVAIPPGYYGRIAPRSGLAFKYGIDVLAGVIDSGYRNEIKVILVNHGDKNFTICTGDRIAQLIIEKIITPPVEIVDELDSTERGMGGFGSTGVK